MKIRTALSAREHYYTDNGSKQVPVFSLDDKGELVISGQTNLFAEIQSHLDEVLLDKIIARNALIGETLSASSESFGDSTVLPKDLLDLNEKANQVNSFKSSLSNEDLSILLEKGFDKFIQYKVEQAQAQAQSQVQAQVDNNKEVK